MTAIKEHQFEILPSAEAISGFTFGIGEAVSVESFDPGESTWATQDSSNPRNGAVGFGRDVLGGRTWAWESHANRETVADAVKTVQEFASAWAPELLVEQPGEVVALRYRVGDRYRRVFGRPRRFAAPPTNQILNGYVPITHDFATVDAYSYDDQMQSQSVPFLSTSTGGGLEFPLKLPTTVAVSETGGASAIYIGGNARAYPIIRFNGPWTNPTLSTDSWTLSWTGGIAEGEWIEIDLRPWRLTVRDSSGASRAGGLAKRTWLEDMYFEPARQHAIRAGGIAPGGGAAVTISWRDTYTSY